MDKIHHYKFQQRAEYLHNPLLDSLYENKGEKSMVRNLSKAMEGEDVKLLHDEMERLGYRIHLDEKKKKYFGDETHNPVIEFLKKHKLSSTGILDESLSEVPGIFGVHCVYPEIDDQEKYH